MKITSIRAIPASPDATAHPMFNFPPWNFVFVKVETDEGFVGWGDATCGPMAVVKMVEEFGELLIGEWSWASSKTRCYASGANDTKPVDCPSSSRPF